MPIKSHKTPKDKVDNEKDDEDILDQEELEDEDEDMVKEFADEAKDKPEPKINFEYQEPDEKVGEENDRPIKREETLEELANKYRDVDEPREEIHGDAEDASGIDEHESTRTRDAEEEVIPQMKAQMPTSGIYSAQDIRRGNGELHQAPYMRSSFSSHNTEPNRPNKSSKLHFVILAVIGLVVLGSAVYLLKYQFKAAKPVPSDTPAPVVQTTPSPSPTPMAIDRSKYTVRVLNGTGKSGLAASVAGKLKDLGYKTDKTANAPSANETTIKAKSGNDDLIKQLITDLAGQFTASSASASLKSNDASDAEVTLGGK